MKKIILNLLATVFVLSLLLTAVPISATEVDKSELEALVEEAIKMKESDYNATTTDWIMFENTLDVAAGYLIDDDVSQEDIDLAVENLNKRIDKLGPKESSTVLSDESVGSNQIQMEDIIASGNAVIIETQRVNVSTEKETKPMPKSTAEFSKGGFVYLGCGSTVALSALAVVGIIGAALAIKKKED